MKVVNCFCVRFAALAVAFLFVSMQTATATKVLSIPTLTEQAQAAGMEQTYDGPWEFFVGGGLASFDCNQDFFPDVFIAGGANPAKLFVNHSKRNKGLQFSEKRLLIEQKFLHKVTGAYPINIDNDAYVDLVVLRIGENLILKGNGDCTFEPANKAFNFNGGNEWTTSFSAVWEKGQRYPTLAFGNYVDRSAPDAPWGTCHDNVLLRPNGNRVPDYSRQTALAPGYCSLSMLFTDWNNSGTTDLRVANDRQYYRGGQEQLWHISAAAKPYLYKQADGWHHLKIWGMSIAEQDLNGDGSPEYAISSMGDTLLQTLTGQLEKPSYKDIAFDAGTTAHRPYTGDKSKPSTGWHTQFADFNNDAYPDLFIAKGNVNAMPEAAAFDPDNLLLGTPDGRFVETGNQSGIALNTKGRGAMVEDFDLDGQLDLLVVNRGDNVSLFHNVSNNGGNWIRLQLKSDTVNAQSVGAKISVTTNGRTQTKTVQVGGGHASGRLGFAHFGLGAANHAQVFVHWPNGQQSNEITIKANQTIVINTDGTMKKITHL
ncbi:MAG: CRTAC1 family protein [Arenicellales bacterium WSBS_2016_MAG_OTU3]